MALHGISLPVSRTCAVLEQAITTQSQRAYRIWFGIFLGLVSIFSIPRFFSMLAPIWAPWDMFILLNGGWRIINAQTPHVDFYNPIGVLPYLPVALGMKIGSISAASLVQGIVIFGIFFALGAWFISRDRLSAPVTFLFAIFIFMLSTANRPLSYGIHDTTYAMIYNRYGYALLALLLVLLFMPRRVPKKSALIWEGLAAGILLALMFYCKITYFMVGGAALALYFLLNRFPRAWAGMVCVGFALVAGVLFLTVHLNNLAYLRDLEVAAQSQSAGMRLRLLLRSIKYNLLQMAVIGVLFVAVFMEAFRSGSWRQVFLKLWKPALLVGFVVGTGILISSGNASEKNEVPLLFVAGILLLGYAAGQPTSNAQDHQAFRLSGSGMHAATALVLVGTLFLMGQIFVKDTASFLYKVAWNLRQASSVPLEQRFQSETLADYVIPPNSDWVTAYWIANQVPERINEGLDMLRPFVDKDTRIFCFCLTDPFSYALEIPPAVGTPLWWDEDYSFNVNTYPDPSTLFRDVTLAIRPVLDEDDKGCCQATVVHMEEQYQEYIDQHFDLVAQSDDWQVLRKRK